MIRDICKLLTVVCLFSWTALAFGEQQPDHYVTTRAYIEASKRASITFPVTFISFREERASITHEATAWGRINLRTSVRFDEGVQLPGKIDPEGEQNKQYLQQFARERVCPDVHNMTGKLSFYSDNSPVSEDKRDSLYVDMGKGTLSSGVPSLFPGTSEIEVDFFIEGRPSANTFPSAWFLTVKCRGR